MSTERISFRPAGLWRLFLPLGLLVVVSLLVNGDAWRQAPWTIYAVFAAVLGLLTAAHFLLRRYYYLELSPDGLTVATLGRKRFFAWREIEDVALAEREIDTAARGTVLLLRLRQASPLRKIIGGDVSLLAVYERTPTEIAALLRARLEMA